MLQNMLVLVPFNNEIRVILHKQYSYKNDNNDNNKNNDNNLSISESPTNSLDSRCLAVLWRRNL